MREWFKRLRRSHAFMLSLSATMIVFSLLTVSDLLHLRGDPVALLAEARATTAESLTVQIAMALSRDDDDAVADIVKSFVERADQIDGIVVVRKDGTELSRYGEIEARTPGLSSTTNSLNVPINEQGGVWGEVQLQFSENDLSASQMIFYCFVAIAGFFLFFMFFRTVLRQLDPSQVVPGRVNTAFNLLGEAIVILDSRMQIMLANEAMAKMLGTSTDALIGHHIDTWPWRHAAEGPSPWSVAVNAGSFASNEPVKLAIPGQTTRSLRVSCAAVGTTEDRTRGVLVSFDDLTTMEERNKELAHTLKLLKRTQVDLLKKNQELETLATRDPLTGVANRRTLLERLQADFTRSRRERRVLSCLMVDIDHFKKINDSCGHVVGDEVIRAVAATLSAHCREYDLVGRYGGEEFMVILPDLDEEKAMVVAERIRIAIHHIRDDQTWPLQSVSASLGIAALTDDVADTTTLIDRADQALYAAKQGGRDQVRVFDPRVVKLHKEDGATLPVGAQSAAQSKTPSRDSA